MQVAGPGIGAGVGLNPVISVTFVGSEVRVRQCIRRSGPVLSSKYEYVDASWAASGPGFLAETRPDPCLVGRLTASGVSGAQRGRWAGQIGT